MQDRGEEHGGNTLQYAPPSDELRLDTGNSAPRFAGLYGRKSGPIIGEQKAKHYMYVELHMASAFSFLQGASSPEALVDRAAALGYTAIALVDRDGLYGAPRFHKAATAAGLKPIIGAELTIAMSNRSQTIRNARMLARSSNPQSATRNRHSSSPSSSLRGPAIKTCRGSSRR